MDANRIDATPEVSTQGDSRKEWTRPRLTQILASDAEAAGAANNDGPGTLS